MFCGVTLYQRVNIFRLFDSPLQKDDRHCVPCRAAPCRAVSDGTVGKKAINLTPFLPIALVVSGALSEYF